ncbi:MAG: hypothetical protein ABIZ09_06710 [Rhodoferax sp.]
MNLLKRLFKALFNVTLGPLLALVLIFEEWGWEPLQRLMAQLARLPVWSHLERLIRRLPPYGALLVFFVPMLMLLPIKLLALYGISHGHPLLGLCVVLVAKLTGTAVVARLFSLTQPALMQLPWFARLYGRWIPWKDALIAQVKNSVSWRTAAASVRSIRKWLGF